MLSIEESGLSQRPTRVRTRAPRGGQTPKGLFHFNWDHLSAIAGMHLQGVCFQVHEGAINKGLPRDEAYTGAITSIQRLDSTTILNIHLHALVLDGIY